MENRSVYFKEALHRFADALTGDGYSFIEMKHAADGLHDLFVEAGGINAFGDAGPGTFSTTGNAVSPETAARCLLDFARTRKFAAGLKEALQYKLETAKALPVKVLYAGSGPYALLAMLMTPYFTPEEIQFTVLDIHTASVESVNRITAQFNAEGYFENIITADATKYKTGETGRPDVIVIETMLNALRKEQQVTVAANLAPQLADGGIMIPEEIKVTPVFTEISIRQAAMYGEDLSKFTQPASHALPAAAVLNIETATAANENIRNPFAPVTVSLEEDFLLPNYVVELQTEIKVWGEQTLQLFETALTIPLKISEGEKLFGKEQIIFTYNNGPVPGFVWEIK